MNIVMIIDSLAAGGAQRQFINLAIGLHERGHSVNVCSYHPQDFFLSRLQEAGIGHQLFSKKHRFDCSPALQLAKLVRSETADLVIAFMKTPCAYAEMARILNPRTPLIVSERCGLSDGRLTFNYKLGYMAHLIASCVTTNSHDNKTSIVDAIPLLKKKTRVIYNGVEDKFVEVGKKRIALGFPDCKKMEDQTNTAFSFCAVAARATKGKGLFDLIEAAALLRKRGVDYFSIDWIGPYDDADHNVLKAKQLIAESELTAHWIWAGASNNTEQLLPLYDAFILPSQVDGVANTLCEALSCALPVIVTNIHDNSTIVKHGQAGLLCDAQDPASMADKMNQMMQLPPQSLINLSQAAFSASADFFQMAQYVDNWEKLSLEVCGQATSSVI